MKALDFLGAPLPAKTNDAIRKAIDNRDARKLQQALDRQVLLVVSINPEERVKVARGPAKAVLQQGGYTPVLVKVLNDSTATKRLRVSSPQAGPVYSGEALLSLQRQRQTHLKTDKGDKSKKGRFLDVEMFTAAPMTNRLSGLRVEYAIALIYSGEAGKREATLAFDIGQGTQDLGFRGEVPVLFDVRPAVPVKLGIRDADGSPTIARLLFQDKQGRVYPSQAKRLAPDFFFQPHVYRGDGDVLPLPPGKFTLRYNRGPEYLTESRTVTVPEKDEAEIDIKLKRWVNPMRYGFYSGDHHIHAAGCAHYTSPTEGVTPKDMFRQVKGEGLNVGCVLTWGPCFAHQRQFFSPAAHEVSEPFTVLKYDLEISGFGSQALGHVCLLNLKDQTYPGTRGTTEGWPTWTTPVLRWAKKQGGVTGYAHSASGLRINPKAAAKRLLEALDEDKDGRLSERETASGVMPEEFARIDRSRDGRLSADELEASIDRAADRLPNLAVPEMNGVGAMEVCVSVSEGVCDFISSMDTERVQEWNMWYHILNCGFPLKVSGETDFPCMSSRRVGKGRVYVKLGKPERIDFAAWCEGLARGRSYVSDGYAHALAFTVNGEEPGRDDVKLDQPGRVTVKAKVAFAPETPKAVAHGTAEAPGGKRQTGDTRELHLPRTDEIVKGGERLVEVVVNGVPVASRKVAADGKEHDLTFTLDIKRSSWVALRHFPQMHTNPVNVIVAGKPIRASRKSALWCVETIKQLWRNRRRAIAPAEREEAERTFQRAIKRYEAIAREAPEGS